MKANLAVYTNFLLENIGQVDVVYTDFEKAFDRVDHFILLQKLQSLGIHEDLLRWVTSYLFIHSLLIIHKQLCWVVLDPTLYVFLPECLRALTLVLSFTQHIYMI